MTSAPADDLLAALARRGLATPTRILLDAHRPIAPLLGDAADFLSPMLAPLGLRWLTSLIADPERTATRLAELNDGTTPNSGAAACQTSEG
jgi:hypothetical protein